jgi:murein DD-endopeptidase MepM/ murein hydrolase activator NlpD
MHYLLKNFIFVFLFLLLAAPARAQNCVAYPPDSPTLDLIIQQARDRGGAAALVPEKLLKAIYYIEATTAYTNPANYSCQPTTPNSSALGLMQILDSTYNEVVAPNERMNDNGVCQPTNCKLSRCNPVDAMEIAARVLLYKAGVWDKVNFRATGAIKTKQAAYTASCLYYAASPAGPYEPDDLTDAVTPRVGANPKDPEKKQSYCEFVVVKAGLYNSPNELPWPRAGQGGGSHEKVNWKLDICTSPTTSPTLLTFDFHPLRPFPKQGQSTDKLTPYCVMRPIAVEQNRFDRREEFIDRKTYGILTQDFTHFITPLLSITDPKKSDYSLPFNDKAQRYLADFLEGRAYYEPQPEPDNPTPAQVTDLFNRLGVFRKLAPASYQDQLKKAMIYRADNQFIYMRNPYGFEPASQKINNYVVGSWQGQTVTLKDYWHNNAWAPLPEEYKNTAEYAQAYQNWKLRDGGKWAALWPYVPMFTREDTEGIIQIVDSVPPPAPYSPSGKYIENNRTIDQVTVSHPHLARTYELTTSLSYLLTPQAVHETAVTPELKEEWIPKIWEDNDMWLDPSYPRPYTAEVGVEIGPVCDVDPTLISPITSSGDLAYDSIFTTSVNRQDLQVPNPEYDPRPADPADAANCGAEHFCEKCKEKRINLKDQYGNIVGSTIDYTLDESGCFYYKQIRSSPDYLISYTPFLNEILTSVMGGSRGIFDLFKPAGVEKQPYEQYSWPGQGNAGEESPNYDFEPNSGENGWGEAGARKPGDSQSYYYRYLGSIQCAKERVLQVLQPFITGTQYKPYAYDCFPELQSLTSSVNTQGKWLAWPHGHKVTFTSCYKEWCRPYHPGLDLATGLGNQILAAADGVVNSVGTHPVFGNFVIINHNNGFYTLYAHLQSYRVRPGDNVKVGQPIGQEGSTGDSTGPHLHFGLSQGGNINNFGTSNDLTVNPCEALPDCDCNPTIHGTCSWAEK